MTVRKFVQEASKLAKKSSDGSYPVVIISEGEGSSGRYSAELLQNSAHVFEGVGSWIDHPIDPSKPHLRPLKNISGRIANVHVGEDNGKVALLGDYTPDQWHAEWVAEYADLIGLSIYCAADGEVMEDGRLDVHEFDAADVYRSVDLVTAAGRGGRFKRAEESLRALESSLGTPEGNKPGATAAPGEKERNMEKEVLEAVVKAALAEALAPVVAFVAEQKAAADAAVAEAETKVTAATEEKDAAIEAYSVAVKAISEAELLPSQKDDILAAAKAGQDVAPLIESAKKVVEEARTVVGENAGYVINEGAGKGNRAASLSLNLGGRR